MSMPIQCVLGEKYSLKRWYLVFESMHLYQHLTLYNLSLLPANITESIIFVINVNWNIPWKYMYMQMNGLSLLLWNFLFHFSCKLIINISTKHKLYFLNVHAVKDFPVQKIILDRNGKKIHLNFKNTCSTFMSNWRYLLAISRETMPSISSTGASLSHW